MFRAVLAVWSRLGGVAVALSIVAFLLVPTAEAAPQLIAERPAWIGPVDAAVSGLDAEDGVVAWQESRLAARAGGEQTHRLAVLVGGTIRRTDWRRLEQFVDVGPTVDASGHLRTRLRTWSCDREYRCTATVIRSPWSLRRVEAEWVERRASPAARRQPDVLGRTVATDGSGVIDVERAGGLESQPSHCAFRPLGRPIGGPLPSIEDCRLRSTVSRAGMVVAGFTRPSERVPEPDSKNSGEHTPVFAALDRAAATPAWVDLGTYAVGRATSSGVQGLCLLGHRVVVLSGTTDVFEPDDGRSTFRLSTVRPAGGTPWSTRAPELGLDASNDVPSVELACTGRWVYATYIRSWPRSDRTPVARVVRYRIPA